MSEFVLNVYKRKDVNIKELNYNFIYRFENYLKIEKNHRQSTIYKDLQQLKTVVGIAVKNELLEKNPFITYKVKNEQNERGFLMNEEIDLISNLVLKSKKLEIVRDCFIFSCYSGIAYIDIYNLTKANIFIGIDGERWIVSQRQKSFSKFMVPLLPEAMKILEKYHMIHSDGRKRIFHVFSNQKMNSYLKEIADLCGIKKNLTFHIARHTFATTVTLTNGVPIETISKMLGHKSIKTTQIYSKVVEQKVSYDMKILKEKLLQNNSPQQIKNHST